ncbi:MAG: hypothetical protein ACR2L2_20050, partial [Acidobacteriota bacterium]
MPYAVCRMPGVRSLPAAALSALFALEMGEMLSFRDHFRSPLRSAGPLPYGRGSVGAPSPACGIRHTAYGC